VIRSSTFELLAEGYRRVVNVRLDFAIDGEPMFRMPDQPEWI
jgi:hypothetical protein